MADYVVLVTASRTWPDPSVVHRALDEAEGRAVEAQATRIVVRHGAAKGGDMMADAWAHLRSPFPLMTRVADPHPLSHADWHPGGRFDPAAGMRRNGAMMAAEPVPDEVLGFADECRKPACRRRRPHDSHGTADAMARAEKASIPVRRFTTGGAGCQDAT